LPEPLEPSLPEILEARAGGSGGLAFRFLPNGTSGESVDWSYRDLAEHAATVAHDLERQGLTGRRVVLALDPGLHYIAALFGIFRAGATAVPCFPPTGKRAVAQFLSIVEDCAPDAVIADRRYAEQADKFGADLPPTVPRPRWLFVDDRYFADAPPAARRRTEPAKAARPAEVALLQYTSGSTGAPKGVMLTHENLISNCRAIERVMGVDPDRIGCSWLPPYHDMGLMGTILIAVHGGWPVVLLSPAHFVQRPYRWLKAITDYG